MSAARSLAHVAERQNGASRETARSASAPPGVGNLEIQRHIRGILFAAKLHLGDSGDPLEKRADQIAEQAVSGTSACACGGNSCASCRATAAIRRAPDASAQGPSPANPAAGLAGLGSGDALPVVERAFFEERLGARLDKVRVHHGPTASPLAKGLGARAFAVGNDLVFASGAYEPGTRRGRLLLGHEIAHTLQNAAGAPARVRRQEDTGGASPASGPTQQDAGPTAEASEQPPEVEASDPKLVEEFEDELKANEANADQDDDLMLRAYSSRVVLLLTLVPRPVLKTEDDLSRVMEGANETAKGELETVTALGAMAEFGLGLRPFGFPLTWSDKIRTALTLGIDRFAVLAEFVKATVRLTVLAGGLSDAILEDGLLVPMSQINSLTGYRLHLEDAALEHGGPIADFARATIRYMQLRYFQAFAFTWETEVDRISQNIADGSIAANWFEWKLFVDNKQQILRELPERAMVALATSEEEAQQIETDTISVADAAVGLGLSSALTGFFSGILGGWELGLQLFDEQMGVADGAVASYGDGEKLTHALRWAYANGYFGAAAAAFVDQLIANGPKILATIAAIIIAQFIPGVDIVLNVYLYLTTARDVIKMIDALGSALSAVMNASTVLRLQQASATLAQVLTDGGIQIMIVLATMGIGGAVAKLKGKAATLREAEPALSELEAERRALKELSPEERAPLERAQEMESAAWKESLSKEDQDFLRRPENAAARKTWEEMNPIVRRILTRCGSSCIPHNATPAQAAQITQLVDRLKPNEDMIEQLREYFHTRRDVLQDAIEDANRATDIELLEAIVYRDPVVPAGASADIARRIGDILVRFKLSPSERAMLREYFQVRTADLDGALQDVESVTAKSQLTRVIAEAAEERAPAAAGTPPIPRGGGDYRHAIAEHGAQLDPQHMMSCAPTKPVAGTAQFGVQMGQWYNNDLIAEVDALPRPANVGTQAGRIVYEIDVGRPVGRVYLPDGLVVSDVTWVRVIRDAGGRFFNAFPITAPGAVY